MNIKRNHIIEFETNVTPKGIKTFKIFMDEFDLIETGTEIKNDKPVAYYKFQTHE